MDPERVGRALQTASRTLLAHVSAEGSWPGHLSSSALSTATAVAALDLLHQNRPEPALPAVLARGRHWLVTHANADGGWGDTIASLSNLSTTTLAWAALGRESSPGPELLRALRRAEDWICRQAGGVQPDQLAPAIVRRYGKDRTFSVPILTLCALAGRLGEGREAWRHVIPLPFELAACPASWFAALRLPVVSYALPALIAIGQARFHHAPPRNPLSRALRQLARPRTLRVLQSIQPPNGGFLEATPLTSFVTMSLAGIGLADHPVTRRGAAFLLQSQREDGSWPIDTNLATWLTTWSVHALGGESIGSAGLTERVRSWLMGQQYRRAHLYTNAAAGGWAWTDLPGGVPDADDTSGALLALLELAPNDPRVIQSADAGLHWLLGLRNRDGGIPTFCRGWGTLPFDRSCADITAHAIRAWLAWRPRMPGSMQKRLTPAIGRALDYLNSAQRPDGSWVPLWFGNQHHPKEENPVYGTSRVLLGLAQARPHKDLQRAGVIDRMIDAGLRWLLTAQNQDDGWGAGPGAPSSVEETALSVEALAALPNDAASALRGPRARALERGASWLIDRVESGAWTVPAPIGFYFARLWYFEDLYPIIFTTAALRQLRQSLAGTKPRAPETRENNCSDG